MKTFLAFFSILVLASGLLAVGLLGAVGYTHLQKPDPAKAWCDAPPVDGAGAPAACN